VFLLKNHFDRNGNNNKSRENEYDCRLHHFDFSYMIFFRFVSFKPNDEMEDCYPRIAAILQSIFQRGLIHRISFSFSPIIPQEIKQCIDIIWLSTAGIPQLQLGCSDNNGYNFEIFDLMKV